MPRRRAPWPLLLLGLAAGCPDNCDEGTPASYYVTESGKWEFSAGKLQADPCDLPGSAGHQKDEPLLVGTRWCPRISGAQSECYEDSITGPGQLDGDCLEVTGSGELLWRFDPIPCDHEGLFFPELLRVRSLDASEVRGRLVSYLDALALADLSPETGAFPLEAMRPPDATLLKVAAGEPVDMAVNLWAGERRVAWSGDRASLEVEVLHGEAPIAVLDEEFATVLLQFPAGSEAALSLVVGPTRVPLGHVRGVALETLEELEVVVAYTNYPNPDESRSRIPTGARAVARDGDGDLVYGARAEWEVLAGSFPFMPTNFYTDDANHDDANHDYTLLIDKTVDPEGNESNLCFMTPTIGVHSFTGRIAANVAGLHAEVDLAWSYEELRENAEYLEPLRPGPNCEGPGFEEPGACACTSAPQHGPVLACLALLALGTARRRRRDVITR